MAENPDIQVIDGRRAAPPRGSAELKQAIHNTRDRMTASLDSIGRRLPRPARTGWLGRAAAAPAVQQHDALAAAVSMLVAVRQLAPLVRAVLPGRALRVALIGACAAAALVLAYRARAARRVPHDRLRAAR